MALYSNRSQICQLVSTRKLTKLSKLQANRIVGRSAAFSLINLITLL